MFSRTLRRFLPDSLGGWVFTVLVTAVILLYGTSLVTYVIFFDAAAAAAAAGQAADQFIVFKRIIEQAVKGMLPRNPLGRAMYRKLKVYAGPEHPHSAQQPQVVEI